MQHRPQTTPSAILLILTLLVTPALAYATAPCDENHEDIPAIALEEVVSGLSLPVHITHANDASGRLYVVEQRGVIKIISQGRQTLSDPFLDIRNRVASGGEKGLLSLAFHPDYRKNGFFFVNYTQKIAGKLNTVISRFSRNTKDRADINSEVILLRISQPYDNHNGGQLAFGQDGYLYIGMGDGGSQNDPHNNAQNPATLLGSLLRIDVNTSDDQTSVPYTIPQNNPFVGKKGFRGETWGYGLRNPWRFSFDALTGQLYLADVGQNDMEEINLIQRGGNYGWNIMEGDICTPAVKAPCQRDGMIPPLHTYYHSKGYSITGGFVYRGKEIPSLCGTYLYADYVTQRIWGMRHHDGKLLAEAEIYRPSLTDKIARKLGKYNLNISSFGEDENFELYIAEHTSGKVFKIVAQ